MKTPHSNPAPNDKDDLVAEYTFDYTKAKPNRFATQDSIYKPFLEFSVTHIDEGVIGELKKFTKTAFNIDDVLSSVSELKYTKILNSLINCYAAIIFEGGRVEFTKASTF
ncbi:hypothetical protein [Chamaesiphon sp. VAR_69_metabat_338]|uniref:hypothetical protein n=1 Tax=Chamaesiphon sp. VAR_69_metabat_338 TaxID=2964704 RepID=UPI00286E3E37|nr:hypothetical protein [Chamaesiphon sp. VAR_69_metabat_338]